jgi:PAS domain-containing protein
VTPSSGEPHTARLTALIARQQQELERLRTGAAARSLVDLARGMLMERLGCTPQEARDQLSHLSQQSGTEVTELAAQITGQDTVPSLQAGTAPGAETDVRVGMARAAMELSSEGQGMAAAVLEEVLAPAGAAAVAIWLIAPDGGLELAGEAGFGPGEASRWRRIPPGMNTVAQRAAEDGAEVWWPSGPPSADASTPLIGRWPVGARAVLPLHSANQDGSGSIVGALEACWPAAQPQFPRGLRRQLTALAETIGQTLGSRTGSAMLSDHDWSWLFGLLEGLHESVLVAQAVRDDAGAVTDFRIGQVSRGFRDPAGRAGTGLAGRLLTEAYPSAARPANVLDLALQVHASGEPAQLSTEVTHAAAASGTNAPVHHVRVARLFDGVVITWRRAPDTEGLAALLQHAQRLGRIGSWEENVATGSVLWSEPTFTLFGEPHGRPVPLSDLHQRVPGEDIPAVEAFRQALLQRKTATATAFRIIRADDGSLRQIRAVAEPVTDTAGTLISLRGAYQDVSSSYHTETALAAARGQLAGAEERAEEEHQLALRLQQAIIPLSSDVVQTAGLDVAARYRPAGAGHLVSGDWYDTALLPDGQVLLAVGDIAGHGIEAVTGMVSLRNGLRSLAVTGAGPASLLTWLNQAAYCLTREMATAICGLYDPQTHTLRWARAGHLPPVLVRDGEGHQLAEPHGVMLGATSGTVYEEVRTPLKPGDTLLLFTDGLIERRRQRIDDALRLLLQAASQPVTDVAHYADQVLGAATPDTGDDACLLAVHLRHAA